MTHAPQCTCSRYKTQSGEGRGGGGGNWDSLPQAPSVRGPQTVLNLFIKTYPSLASLKGFVSLYC